MELFLCYSVKKYCMKKTPHTPYKVAYLIPGMYNSGGMERVLSSKSSYLAENGCEITIITTNQQGRVFYYPISNRINVIDLDINYSEINSKGFFTRSIEYLRKNKLHKSRLATLLHKEKFDIVISMFSNERYWINEINDGSKKVGEIHFTKYNKILRNRSLLLKLLDYYRTYKDDKVSGKFDKFVVLTDEDKLCWKNKSNIIRIYNSLDDIPEKLSTLTSKRALSVGRLCYQKGFDKLISVWEIVVRRHSDWHLDIFGSGEDFDRLSKIISDKSLGNYITINPPTKNIMQEYLNSSMYLMTSVYEGFPLVLLEAMSCGLPLVSFDYRSGPKELIRDTGAGFVVANGDVKGFAEKVCQLIEDRGLMLHVQSKGQDNLSLYSKREIMGQWISLFDELMNNEG